MRHCVFAIKAAFLVIQFKFTVTLTCIYTLATHLTARSLTAAGFVETKRLPTRAVVAVAGAFAGYIVRNVSLALNTVGFCQLIKVAIAPTVLSWVLFPTGDCRG